MRTKRLIDGLNNTQKVRVIVDGVGFYTTVEGAFNMVFSTQQNAVTMALVSLGCGQYGKEPISGIGRRYNLYNEMGQLVDVDVQVDLV